MTAGRVLLVGVGAWLMSSTPVHADWTVAAYLGNTWTSPADLTVDRPASGGQTTLSDVAFDSRSFESPPYYGYRVGWFQAGSGTGVEGELIHLKVYAHAETLGADVRRFSISHGLNLLLANAVVRRPLPSSHRASITARVGAGVAIPHAESDIAGRGRLLAEYKLTTAAPSVSVAGGTIQARYLSQHLAAGLGVAW